MSAGNFVPSQGVLILMGGLMLGLSLVSPLLLSPAYALAQPQLPDSAKVADLRARSYFVQGLTQSYLDDYEEAVTLLKQALKASPQNPAILSALGRAEAGRGNFTSAVYYARTAHEQAPDRAYYYHQHAELLQEAGRPREAADVYRALLSADSTDTKGRLALARLQTTLNHPRQALRQYEALADSSQHVGPQAYVEMLDLYQKLGDQDGLESTLERLIHLRRENPRYRLLLGQLYTEQQRYREAIPLFETLLQETPNDPRLLSRLKMLYLETGQPRKAEGLGAKILNTDASPDQLVTRARSMYDRADDLDSTSTQSLLNVLQEALSQSPTHAGALDLKGTIYYERNQYAKAAATLDKALEQNPRVVDRWQLAASAALKADSLRQSIALAEEGRLLFPGTPGLIRIEARARLRLGNAKRARADFEDALSRIDTTSDTQALRAKLYAGLGQSLHQLGDLQEASRAFDDALRLSPRSPAALTYYPRTLARRKVNLDRALTLARRAVQVDSSHGAAHGTLGWVLHVRGDASAAVDRFEQAIATGTADAWTYERFGDVQRALGNDALARRYWKEALDRSSHSDSLKQKLQSVPQS